MRRCRAFCMALVMLLLAALQWPTQSYRDPCSGTEQPATSHAQHASRRPWLLHCALAKPALNKQDCAAGCSTEHAPCTTLCVLCVAALLQVTFRKLEDPKEPGLQLELLRENDYDMVTAALAAKLGLDDPSKLRLTQHNAYSSMPQRTPMR